VKSELAKLRFLRRLDAHTMDLSMLPTERRRFLATPTILSSWLP
jgi:hypothetical protein